MEGMLLVITLCNAQYLNGVCHIRIRHVACNEACYVGLNHAA